MLNQNLKSLRIAKGLTQEELAIRLNVVRQTVSKWENGRSVPDADMLISLSELFETSVSTLLGEPIEETPAEDMKVISEKLEVINLQLSRRKASRIKTIRWLLVSACTFIAAVFILLALMQGAYLSWDYRESELAVAGTALHGFEWVFVRSAPFALLACITGIAVTYKRR